MSTESLSQTGMRLKTSPEALRMLYGLLGFMTSFLAPVVAFAVFRRGEWGTLCFLAVPIAGVGAIELLRRLTPEACVVLYPDRMDVLGIGSRRTVVHWPDVVAVHWPSSRDTRIPIRIQVPVKDGKGHRTIRVSLRDISRDERLALIRYLRAVAAGADQTGWHAFCYKQAIPVAESCQAKKQEGDSASADARSSEDAAMRRFTSLGKCYPFLAGIAVPLFIPKFLSRTMWWTLSAQLAISALVNIRLVWGQWASPFTEIVLGTAATCFALGCLAPSRALLSPANAPRVKGVQFWLWLGVTCVPLLGNAAVKGWIPVAVVKYLGIVGYCVLHVPLFLHGWKLKRQERRDAARLEADGQRRWAVYEATHQLPPAEAVDGAVCGE